MFLKMSNLKSAIANMPRAIEKNDKKLLYYIHSTVSELLLHLDEEKKMQNRNKRENAQPIVDEIEKVLKKYRLKQTE
ncbi:hypothetical protein [Fibrobacter sp.]|uniref:hypothetical protein n=1 Tax=Fibrobacter sp. TaxID=35828 RepID=UPI0025BE2B2E|nr:hypothetical protein [Fibrobacter sp.]MBR3070332.1 hypothetical protein [Fibrobacter sp.]